MKPTLNCKYKSFIYKNSTKWYSYNNKIYVKSSAHRPGMYYASWRIHDTFYEIDFKQKKYKVFLLINKQFYEFTYKMNVSKHFEENLKNIEKKYGEYFMYANWHQRYMVLRECWDDIYVESKLAPEFAKFISENSSSNCDLCVNKFEYKLTGKCEELFKGIINET